LNTWWHAAVVTDGRHTTMYVDGCPVARNPATVATGLVTLGLPRPLGGSTSTAGSATSASSTGRCPSVTS
jgi:hypothetical protein